MEQCPFKSWPKSCHQHSINCSLALQQHISFDIDIFKASKELFEPRCSQTKIIRYRNTETMCSKCVIVVHGFQKTRVKSNQSTERQNIEITTQKFPVHIALQNSQNGRETLTIFEESQYIYEKNGKFILMSLNFRRRVEIEAIYPIVIQTVKVKNIC